MELGILIGIAGLLVGGIGLFASRDKLCDIYNNLKPPHSIAVFGPKGAGKTSLLCYLRNKRIPDFHVDTVGSEAVGKVVYDLSGNKSYHFRSKEMYDVDGEATGQWQAILGEQNPNGIIYIIDTQDLAAEIAGLQKLCELYDSILENNLQSDINLRAILILLNKCDIWGNSSTERERQIHEYRSNLLSDPMNQLRKSTMGTTVVFGCSSLTHSEFHSVTNEALRSLVSELARV